MRIKIKSLSPRGLMPKSPVVISLIKRIAAVFLIFCLLGFTAGRFGGDYPFLTVWALFFLSIIFGAVHLYTVENDNVYDDFIWSLLLTIVAMTGLLVPGIFFGKEYFSLTAIFFAMPGIAQAIIWEWDNRPRHIPKSAAILPWMEARLEAAVVGSRYYLVFVAKTGRFSAPLTFGYSVNPENLFQEEFLITWFSNITHRHNTEKTTQYQVPTTIETKWVFYSKPFWVFRRWLDPTRPIKDQGLLWRPALRRVNGRIRLIWVIKINAFQGK